jgi:amino acid transporter
MSVSLILFIITLFGFYTKSILDPLDPFFLVEAMIFVHGLVMLLIGLLKMQKENENLEQKRKGAIAIGKLGAVLMSIGIIPLVYFYAIVNPARGPFGGIPETVLDPLFIGTVLFVLGLIVILISLLSLLIGRLKKQESL